MRRSMAMRIFASMVAVWFGFITIQPLYGDPCQHHQPALAALAEGLGTHSRVGHIMAEHENISGNVSASGVHEMSGAASHEDHDHNHQCHCVGDCCSATPVAMVQPATEWVPAAIARRIAVDAIAPIAIAPQTAAPHTLPFATAPPRALLA